jgi:hypothetical protein
MDGMGYRGKLEQQERARQLRAEAWTLAEIAAELDVAKSSASLWCREVEVDEAALEARRRQRFLSGNEGARRRGPNVLQRRKQAEIEQLRAAGAERIGSLTEKEFLVAGVMLYAGEGSKTEGEVRLANSDPRMVLFFCSWLRRFFDIDESRLRVRLYLHEGLDLDAANRFWSELTGVPLDQFRAPYRAVPDHSIRHTKHATGCPSVSYNCTRTHRAVMGLVHALLSCESAIPG